MSKMIVHRDDSKKFVYNNPIQIIISISLMRRWIHHVVISHRIAHSISHLMWMCVSLMVQVCVQEGLSMSSCRVIVYLWIVHVLGHLTHVVVAGIMMVIIILRDIRGFVLARLLIAIEIILEVTLSDSEYDVLTCNKVVITKNLSLIQHFEIATKG